MRLFLSIVFVLSLSLYAYGQNELTLEQAVKIALQRNTTLQKAENNMKVSESNVKSAVGNFLPSLSASGGWNWSRQISAGGTINFGNFVFNNPTTVTESRNYNASVNTNWTLFDGLSNFAGLSQSKNQLKSAELALENLKQQIVFQTVSYYYTVVNDQQLMKVKEDNVAWNKRNLETIVERNKLGAVTLADVYQQQVQEGQAELDLITAKNNLETAKSNLLYYLGLDVLGNYTFSDSLTTKELGELSKSPSAQYEDIGALVKKALNERADYQSALYNLASAKNGVTMAWSGNLPTLSASGSYSLRANTLGDLSKNRTYYVGLSLNIPIFSGFSVENRVEMARVSEMNAQVDLDDLRRTIKQNLQQTYLNMQAAEKGLEVSKRNVEAATENKKIAEEKYALGSGTLLDVLIANSNYTTARTNYINAEFQYVVLNEQLKYYIGVLDYKKYE